MAELSNQTILRSNWGASIVPPTRRSYWDPSTILSLDPNRHPFNCVIKLPDGSRCRKEAHSYNPENVQRTLQLLSEIDPSSRGPISWHLSILIHDTICREHGESTSNGLVAAAKETWTVMIDSYLVGLANDARDVYVGASREGAEIPWCRDAPPGERTGQYERIIRIELGDNFMPHQSPADIFLLQPRSPYQARRSQAPSPPTPPPRLLRSDSGSGGTFWVTHHKPIEEPLLSPKHRGAHRKPIGDSDCAICILPLGNGLDVVWCQASCGNNVHKSCFFTWAETTCSMSVEEVSMGGRCETPVTCVHCRTEWVWQTADTNADIADGSV